MATLWPSITCEGNSTPATGDTVTSGDTELGLVQVTGSGASWTLTNKEYDGELEPGTVFPLRWDSAEVQLSSW